MRVDYRILRYEGHLRNSTLSYGKRKIPLTLSIIQYTPIEEDLQK